MGQKRPHRTASVAWRLLARDFDLQRSGRDRRFRHYQKAEDKVYLDGDVRLTQGPNVTLGDHIVYDLKTTQAVVTGHVRSLFIPDSDNNTSSSTSSADTTGTAKPKPKRLHRTIHRPESAEQ